ncbi:Jem1p Ecym_6318 [Eremothecium cymbalariae DBVPG|uniref:J domain-containing protein n=1 Tax=Eremothecium cymbalariae (strain CBS 270.75 / DBVPG 7215 / KCTC 17166 / NRRL Y-17582) TaxID=931890 RepID=G8JUB6_ERECY|nr:hypothetical protein Ecym_6318 [Eremothecium cymbalariae DBVPG\
MLRLLICLVFALLAIGRRTECDLNKTRNLLNEQRIDKRALPTYQGLLSAIEQCEGDEWVRLKSEVYYKIGVVQLLLGQELRAMHSFEHVSPTEESPFQKLSDARLRDLYKKFGKWNNIDDEDEDKIEYFSLLERLKLDKAVDLNQVYMELAAISPLNQQLIVDYTDILLDDLSDSFDLNTAQAVAGNYQMLLDKHSTNITLSDRLNLHCHLATIQWFILNSQPVSNLKQCLAIDMDYKPCRDMMQIWNKWNKSIKISSYSLSTLEDYCALKPSDYKDIIEFIFKSKKPLLGKNSALFSKNNYLFIQKFSDDQLADLVNNPPLSSRQINSINNQEARTEFQTALDIQICLAFDMKSQLKTSAKYCDRVLKQVLTSDEYKHLKRYMSKMDSTNGIYEILKAAFDTYPHLAFHLVGAISDRLVSFEHVNSQADTMEHWLLIEKFIKTHNVTKCGNKFVNKIITLLNKKLMQNKQQQYHHQQQQQQQQHHQQHHQQQQQRNNDYSKKDYYKELGVSKNANNKDIRRAYLQLTKKYHPDKQGQLSQEERLKVDEKMSAINEAYETLRDDSKRKEYDMVRSEGASNQRFRGSQQAPPQFNFGRGRKGGFKIFDSPKFSFNFGNGGPNRSK